MQAEASRTVSMLVEVTRCESTAHPRCRACRKPLELVQPSIERPETMLGICPACGGWHYVAEATTGFGLVVVSLPLQELLRGELSPLAARPVRRAAH